MRTMRIKFTRPWRGYKKGRELDVQPNFGRELIRRKVAEAAALSECIPGIETAPAAAPESAALEGAPERAVQPVARKRRRKAVAAPPV